MGYGGALVAAALVGALVATAITENGSNNAEGSSGGTTTSAPQTTAPSVVPATTTTPTKATTTTTTTTVTTTTTTASPEAMVSLAKKYYNALPDDLDDAWKMLSKKGQEKTGGKDKYKKFWNTIKDVSWVEGPTVRPDGTSVEGVLRYERKKGKPVLEHTVLTLVVENGQYKVDNWQAQALPNDES